MRTPFILYLAIVQHGVWGVVLLFTSNPLHTTALDSLAVLVPNQVTDGVIYLAVSVLSFGGLWRQRGRSLRRLALMLPQQFILSLSSIGAIAAVARGSFADGAPYPRDFIFVDQLYTILIAWFHSFALVEHYTQTSLAALWKGVRSGYEH
jgi:hypothetical protein